MNEFATKKMVDVDVSILGANDGKNEEVSAKEVEYCIASGYVCITTTENTYITHISNVVLKTKA